VKKTGVKKMEKVENVVLEKTGKAEGGKVERKAENGQNGQNGNVGNAVLEKTAKTASKKNKEVIAKLIAEKLDAMDIDISGISELSNLAKEIIELNTKIQRLSEERLEKINRAREIYEKINGEAKKLLEFLGLLNAEEVERAIGKTQTAKTTIQRASNGNGLTNKKIVFQGKTYNIASYFARKMGITGGLPGLLDWAKKNGFTVKQNENEIIIS
jgi:hypothetical protein